MGVEITPEARRIWEKYKPSISILEVQHLINYYMELCQKLGVDPYSLDFEDEVTDWKLDYWENRSLIEEFVTKVAAVPREEFDYVGYLIEEAEKMLTPIDHEVIKSKDLKRLENASKRLKKYKGKEKELQAEIDYLRKKYEGTLPEKQAIARTVRIPTLAEMVEEDINRLRDEFQFTLQRATIPTPALYDAEFYKAVSKKRSYTENAERVRRLADRIIKRQKRELPSAVTPEMDRRIARLEEQVKTLTAPARELPPRVVTPEVVVDWWDNEAITIDVDEIWRLRQLLHYKWQFYYLSPENQRKFKGVDTKGAVKLAIFNERITINHLIDMGLDPKDYGV